MFAHLPSSWKTLLLAGLLAANLISVSNAAEGITSFVGWRQDGNACFTSAVSVTNFNGRTGQNILWKSQLPNWSNAGFIMVSNRVFVLSEPWDGYAPWLLCLDSQTGRELWRRELDPVETMPEERRQESRENALAVWRTRRQAERLGYEMNRFYVAHKEKFDGRTPGDEVKAAWEERLTRLVELGYRPGGGFYEDTSAHGSGGNVDIGGSHATAREAERRRGRLVADGLAWCGWRGTGTWLGVGYPTPCSDGRRVYIVTAQAYVACYDLEGNLLWQRRIMTPLLEQLSPEQRSRLSEQSRKNWKAGQKVHEYGTAPILDDLDGDGRSVVLVINAGNMVRCLDAANGHERWAVPWPGSFAHTYAVPRVVRVEGEAVLLTVTGTVVDRDDAAVRGDELLRLRDGMSVGRLPTYNAGKHWGSGTVVIGDGLVLGGLDEQGLHDGSHPRGPRKAGALRLRWNAGRSAIEFDALWQVETRGWSFFMEPAKCGMMLYANEGTLDLTSGIAVHRPWKDVYQGYCDHGLLVAGNHVLRWNRFGQRDFRDTQFRPNDDAFFHFFDRETGAPLGVGTLPISPQDGAPVELRRVEEHDREHWRWLGAATPWVDRQGRLFARSYDFLWCIGKK